MEPTKEQLENASSMQELEKLMGRKAQLQPASITEKFNVDLSAQERRDARRAAEPVKMVQGQVKRKRHPLGLGYLDEEDGENAELMMLKGAVDDRVRRARREKEQKAIAKLLDDLNS